MPGCYPYGVRAMWSERSRHMRGGAVLGSSGKVAGLAVRFLARGRIHTAAPPNRSSTLGHPRVPFPVQVPTLISEPLRSAEQARTGLAGGAKYGKVGLRCLVSVPIPKNRSCQPRFCTVGRERPNLSTLTSHPCKAWPVGFRGSVERPSAGGFDVPVQYRALAYTHHALSSQSEQKVYTAGAPSRRVGVGLTPLVITRPQLWLQREIRPRPREGDNQGRRLALAEDGARARAGR